MSDLPRRKFLAAAGSTLAAAWLVADRRTLEATADYVARLRPGTAYETLTADEGAVLEAATAQIFPSDDTPGAREARVVNFIDRSISTWAKDQRPAMAKLVKELNARAKKTDKAAASFAALTDTQQQAVIASMEKDRHESFFTLRSASIVGMFANPEYGGNFEKQGWKTLGFVDQFSWSAPFGWYDQ